HPLYISGTPPPSPYISTLSLHDALPIFMSRDRVMATTGDLSSNTTGIEVNPNIGVTGLGLGGFNNNSPTFAGETQSGNTNIGIKDRKSTRLNSSHQINSYAALCFQRQTS